MNAAEDLKGASEKALLAAYAEVSRSYHAVDDFRMKLLGLLPLASLVGLMLLSNSQLRTDELTDTSRAVIGFSAIFAAALTLALFSYEIRGIRRSHNLIREGQHLEEALGVGHGQFHVCSSEHEDPSTVLKASNSKLAACVIYSLVLSGWLFIALRFSFQIGTLTCSLCAVGVAGVVAATTYSVVRGLTAS